MSFARINLQHQKRLEKRLRDELFHGRAAASVMLNNLAFGARKEMPGYMATVMTVRSKPFVKSRFRVKKSTTRTQRAEVGVVASPRFSGWTEQQSGAKADRTRVATLLARSRKTTGRIAPKARLKPGVSLPSPKDYPSHNGSQEIRVATMLRTLARKKHKGAFILPRRKGKAGGVYRFGRKKRGKKRVVLLQSFDSRNTQPKRIDWLQGGSRSYLRKVKPHMGAMWAHAMRKTARN
jgi:hypothetical protein